MIKNIASRLREHADVRGNVTAIIHGEHKVTYKELWKTTQSIMAYMLDHGAEKGDRVAILLPNSSEYVAAYYAAIALGAIAVPLNTLTKQRDLKNWIEHAGAKWLIGDSSHPELQAILDL